ncbi:MAG: response regulator [Myxococcales bacterium]|nr:response regulator [Myxococcales bacterium]
MTKKRPLPEDILAVGRALRIAAICIDEDERILDATPRAEQLFRAERGSLRGALLPEITEDAESTSRFLRQCRRSGSRTPGVLLLSDTGAPRRLRCEGFRISDGSVGGTQLAVTFQAEPAQGFVVLREKLEALSREVHRRRRVEADYRKSLEREKRARRAAEDADRMKDEFLAIVSHELRTPLNAVLSWTEILQMEGFEGQTADALERIERNARTLARLINDLLETSRIVSNQVELEVREVVVGEVTRVAVEAVAPRANASGITVELSGDLDARAELDPDRVQQVLCNLLDNAIKFSGEGSLVTCDVQADADWVRFRVSDAGRGLLPDEASFVFDRFRQVDRHATREHGGMGLGLAIARQLVELHGGRIEAQSRGPGFGAVFEFRLPRKTILEPSVAPAAAGEGSSNVRWLRDRRILVVEDNDDAREALVRFLERFGCDAIGVPDVVTAMEELRIEAPTAIISDLQMPGQDGYDLVRQVRGDPHLRGIPILALTAHARPADRERALGSGFNGYLAKPVNGEVLLGELASVARGTR